MKKQTSLSSPTSENIFGQSNGNAPKSTATPSSQNDLFGLELGGPAVANNNDANKNGSASNDLLMLSGPNPFIQNIVNQSYSQQNIAASGMMAPNPFGQPNGMMMPGAGLYQPQAPMNNFAPMNPMANQNKLSTYFIYNIEIVLFKRLEWFKMNDIFIDFF